MQIDSLGLYKKMYMVRYAEEVIIDNYSDDEMKTPMHMSMGAEAISAGICGLLNEDDQVLGTYRSHALYLCKTNDLKGFFAEMYGKKTGCSKGKSGSMHLSNVELGYMGSSAIVAGNISHALGLAYANKIKKNNKVVVVFFGDGATEEGTFWESINVASLMNLPVIFVCEDNEYAMHATKKYRQSYDIRETVRNYPCRTADIDTTDVEQIYSNVKEIVRRVRRGDHPAFLHMHYYRYLEHVGINEDYDDGYRERHELEEWLDKDPIKLQRDRLISLGIDIDFEESSIRKKVDEALEYAKASDFAEVQEIYKDVFYE